MLKNPEGGSVGGKRPEARGTCRRRASERNGNKKIIRVCRKRTRTVGWRASWGRECKTISTQKGKMKNEGEGKIKPICEVPRERTTANRGKKSRNRSPNLEEKGKGTLKESSGPSKEKRVAKKNSIRKEKAKARAWLPLFQEKR